jgi:hypothetical protein
MVNLTMLSVTSPKAVWFMDKNDGKDAKGNSRCLIQGNVQDLPVRTTKTPIRIAGIFAKI